MDTLQTYLIGLQNKVFKLLPMRETYESGGDNHIEEYLANLCANCDGAFACYASLSSMGEVVEVRNNIEFLKNNIDLDFKRWRSIVLRSTRLVHNALVAYERGSGHDC
jgi:hypothetical protein